MFPIRDHNPSGRVPYVTYALMAANIGIFISMLPISGDERALAQFYYDWALLPRRITMGDGYGALLSSQFLHGGWLHLAGNMLFLWIFGDNIEDEMGHLPYLGFYLTAGVLSGLAQVAMDPASFIPMVGASGAIAGVMGSYLLLFPKAKIDILLFLIIIFRIFPIPAWIMLILWFATQFVGGLGTMQATGGVAYWAHAGGFIAGIVLTIPLWLRRGGPAFWSRTQGRPPHPPAQYVLPSSLPKVKRR
ncbi:rhomboid family intramembrane serine protease [Sulfitobacter sp. F26169L]|uniref:rhomboid family intramembrane serine protease n=1 Tax=Sulfitobacter sp. F26169L TaxID=2996015 RepID=UPI002260E44E|nr:rhomboid family intramembrane serine protease [Sulfitobacter sp. F26169L]MCX7566490.1 rhomboid family intramembrane serine protease [Sulfitobacter sp. F26169L]